ncbi:MAG: DUF4136 domain-containing protein [Gammaproteobacteria bacterium]
MNSRPVGRTCQRRRRWHKTLSPIYICLILPVLLAACTTILPVRTDYDREADFSEYRTFTWVSDDPMIMPEGGSPRVSPLNRQRIISAIETELQKMGYDKAAGNQEADFAVAFTVGTRERIDFDSYPLAYRRSWYWRPSYWDYEIRARTYEEGMLAIDIFDQATRKPVWHGFTHKRITSGDRSDPEPVIREAVAAILAKFPPQ